MRLGDEIEGSNGNLVPLMDVEPLRWRSWESKWAGGGLVIPQPTFENDVDELFIPGDSTKGTNT